jgi:hypothetical protein
MLEKPSETATDQTPFPLFLKSTFGLPVYHMVGDEAKGVVSTSSGSKKASKNQASLRGT